MKTLRGWVNLLVSQKVLGEGWLKKDYLAFTHWYSLQQREIFEACKVTNIRINFSICNHGCYKVIKKPRMWWRNRAGEIRAAGWDATWWCLVDLITHAADSRSGWHYPGTWHPDLRECQHVFRKQVLADCGRFVARNKNDIGLWSHRLSVLCTLCYWLIRLSEWSSLSYERAAVEMWQNKVLLPFDGWGKGDRTSCPLSSAHPPTAFMSNSGLAYLYWSA